MMHWQKFQGTIAGTVLALLFASSSAEAHEIRPAYLEVKETAPGQFSVVWRTPVMSGMRLPVVLKLPDEVRNLRDPIVQELPDSLVERRWIDGGPDGLAGKRIEFVGLQATITDVLVRLRLSDGSESTTLVHPSKAWMEVARSRGLLSVAGSYTLLGIEHIGFGIDHLLFVLALMIISNSTVRLLKTVTAFTVAHSITLALATLGFVHVPSKPVEATIALSIVSLHPRLFTDAKDEAESPRRRLGSWPFASVCSTASDLPARSVKWDCHKIISPPPCSSSTSASK